MHLFSTPKVLERVIWNTEKNASEVLCAFFAFVFLKLQPALNLPKPTCTAPYKLFLLFFLLSFIFSFFLPFILSFFLSFVVSFLLPLFFSFLYSFLSLFLEHHLCTTDGTLRAPNHKISLQFPSLGNSCIIFDFKKEKVCTF